MASFKSLNTKKYRKPGVVATPDYLYWKKLSVPELISEHGVIDFIDFSPVEPYYFAVSCSVRVNIYNPITKLVAKNIMRFQENAYGGSFRRDGQLLVAGDGEGLVKMFDVSSKNVLRLYRGHKAPVHRTFFTSDGLHIASFSDDKTVKLWNLTTEKPVHTFLGHTDYIRAGCVSPVSSNIILSGGYDHIIKMHDIRTGTAAFSLDHGSPIESLLFLPTGGIFLSAGETEIKVWDAFAGGKLLAKLSQHHQTVTCLRLASNGKRILSGGLDRHVKVYDVATYQTVHTMDFPNSVLSLGVAPNDRTIAAGLVGGVISLQNMEKESDDQAISEKRRVPFHKTETDQVVSDYERNIQAKYDVWLRKYEYIKALDCVLRSYVINKTPHVTVSVMQELIHRKGLHRALAGRSHGSIGIIVQFIMRYIGEYRFTRVLTSVGEALLDVYEESFGDFTDELRALFIKLSKTLKEEIALTYELLELQGALELITAGASIGETIDDCIHFTNDISTISQSEKAKQTPIINVN